MSTGIDREMIGSDYNSINRTAETEGSYIGPQSDGQISRVRSGINTANKITAGYTKTASADKNIIDMPWTSGERTLNQSSGNSDMFSTMGKP